MLKSNSSFFHTWAVCLLTTEWQFYFIQAFLALCMSHLDLFEKQNNYLLCQGYVFAGVCLFACVQDNSQSRLQHGFWWNFKTTWILEQGKDYYILVVEHHLEFLLR